MPARSPDTSRRATKLFLKYTLLLSKCSFAREHNFLESLVEKKVALIINLCQCLQNEFIAARSTGRAQQTQARKHHRKTVVGPYLYKDLFGYCA